MPVKHTFTTRSGLETREITPVKAIRAFCLECVGFIFSDVKDCTHKVCPIYPYRLGRDPSKKRESNTDALETYWKGRPARPNIVAE